MAIMLCVSESTIKNAAVIAARENRSIISVIEECFNYGAKALYQEGEQRQVKSIEQLYSPPSHEEMESLHSLTSGVVQGAKEAYSSLDGDWSDSYSDLKPSADGGFEI